MIHSTLLGRDARPTLLESYAHAPPVSPNDTVAACFGVKRDNTPQGGHETARRRRGGGQSSRHHVSVLGGNPIALNGTARGLRDPRDLWRQSCHASPSVG